MNVVRAGVNYKSSASGAVDALRIGSCPQDD